MQRKVELDGWMDDDMIIVEPLCIVVIMEVFTMHYSVRICGEDDTDELTPFPFSHILI